MRDELASDVPFNVLLTGELVEQIAATEPETLAALNQALDDKRGDVIGGDYREREAPIQSLESVLWGLQRGKQAFSQHLRRPPTVFARRRYGLGSFLPQLLARLEYQGVAHWTLDDGRFPQGEQSKTRWEGCDGTVLDALTRVPMNAADSSAFLTYAEKMGESMDLDHVATVGFAHWPGDACDWYGDLRRMAKYAPVLGRFVTLGEYFAETDSPGQLSKFLADEYRAPYLKQAVRRRKDNPLSAHADHARRRMQLDSAGALSALSAMLSGVAPDEDAAEQARRLIEENEFACGPCDPPAAEDLNERSQALLDRAAKELAQASPRSADPPAKGEQGGWFLFNPQSFARRVTVQVPGLNYLPAKSPIRASQEAKGGNLVVADVPAMGYAWIPRQGSDDAQSLPTPLAEGNVLRNEFLEATINSQTGSLGGLHDYMSRGNRLSQQLAFRMPGPRSRPGDIWRDP
ncbi:MAG: hypothetical protein N2C14_26505, partial [Planctomycetales bacterium]